MDILQEIAIRHKDRILIMDKDLLERKLDVRPGTSIYSIFHQKLKARHYKKLKDGSGWSCSSTIFDRVCVPQISVEEKSILLQQERRRYEMDIPDSIRKQFAHYAKKFGLIENTKQ